MTLLVASDVGKYYGDYCALNGVSFSIGAGEFVSIVGHNGAGKTTLVNLLSGFFKPTVGEVHFKGESIVGTGPVALARRGLARSFQLVNIFPGLTVRETLSAGIVARLKRSWRLFSALDADQAVLTDVQATAALFGLESHIDRLAGTLSQGQKKLLDVASAFALQPEVILLDEPTSGVSTADKNQVMDTLVNAARKMGVKAIIQVEHDMDIVFRYSDRIIAMYQGGIIMDSTPEKIRQNDDVVAKVIGRHIQ